MLLTRRYDVLMALPERLAAAAARAELSSILRQFAELQGPADSIGDRAVRIGAYNRDTAVLIPLTDFERALENEELLDDIGLELLVAERLARGPGEVKTLEEVALELGLAGELGLE